MTTARFWLCMCAATGAMSFSLPLSAGEFDCVTEPSEVVEIRAPVDGLIERIFVDRGQMVTAGQVVANLDMALEKAGADLAQFKATMNGAIITGQNRVDYAKIKAARRDELYADQYISAQDRDEAVTERRLAESQLIESRENRRLAELEYRRAKEQLRMRTLRTPISGVVVERMMNEGELADSRDQRRPIMKIADIRVLHVETLLPLSALGRIKPGTEAAVTLEAPVGGRYRARVKVVDKIVDTASGTFGVRLLLPNPKLNIPAGVKCRVVFEGVQTERRRAVDHLPAPARAESKPLK